MPALPSSVIEPVWDQFAVLIPEHIDTHPLGCHNPRIPDRTVFDKLVQVLVLGASYERIADSSCSATTIRNRSRRVDRGWGLHNSSNCVWRPTTRASAST